MLFYVLYYNGCCMFPQYTLFYCDFQYVTVNFYSTIMVAVISYSTQYVNCTFLRYSCCVFPQCTVFYCEFHNITVNFYSAIMLALNLYSSGNITVIYYSRIRSVNFYSIMFFLLWFLQYFTSYCLLYNNLLYKIFTVINLPETVNHCGFHSHLFTVHNKGKIQ